MTGLSKFVKWFLPIIIVLLLCVLAIVLIMRKKTFKENDYAYISESGFVVKNEEKVEIVVPNATTEKKLLFIQDLHVIEDNEEIVPNESEAVKDRIDSFSYEGIPSADSLDGWVEYINTSGADMVVFNGDILDFCSEGNCEVFKEAVNQINCPYVYLRADHDILPSYITDQSTESVMVWQSSIDDGLNSNVYWTEFDDFILLCWNNSTSQMTEDGYHAACEVLDKEKPVILATHVPLQSQIDASLGSKSESLWQDRILAWGKDCYYNPDKITKKFLKKVYAEDSPVVYVFSGHVHFTWNGQLTEGTNQYVFAPSYERSCGVVTVH